MTKQKEVEAKGMLTSLSHIPWTWEELFFLFYLFPSNTVVVFSLVAHWTPQFFFHDLTTAGTTIKFHWRKKREEKSEEEQLNEKNRWPKMSEQNEAIFLKKYRGRRNLGLSKIRTETINASLHHSSSLLIRPNWK